MNNEERRTTVALTVRAAYRMRQEEMRFYEELASESDRGAAILAAEYFSERLGKAIKKRISTLDDGLWGRLEEKGVGKSVQNRFVGSKFSTRIDIAYVFGLYDQDTRKRLNDILDIRNKFAHPTASNPPNFSTKWVVDRCNDLPLESEPDPDTSRNRYIHYLSEVGNCVWGTLLELRRRTH